MSDPAATPADPLLEKPAVRRSGHGTRGTAAFDRALEKAFHQGRDYITWLPAAEGRPPFLMITERNNHPSSSRTPCSPTTP